MTDKEEIIIDGKGCRYKTWDKDCALTGDNHGDNMKPCKFIDEKNCYYKQLQRKEQECEELKKELDKEHLLMLDKQNKLVKYILALDEIKGLAQSMLDDFEEDSIDQKFEYCKQIGMLIETIINKVKGSECL